MSNKRLLNLGCGYHFHSDWVNVDFMSTGEGVIAHNLNQGIPFGDNEFNVVYHSHILEHFPKNSAKFFIEECYRVLKSGGILRVAIPDLEVITKLYLENLNKALNGSKEAEYNYDWMLLEMYDQTVRNKPGGEMLEYFMQDEINNFDFVCERIGNEARILRRDCLHIKDRRKREEKCNQAESQESSCTNESIFSSLGKFRLGGEIHQWMYDRFSLKRLLESCGFKDIQVKTAFESDIDNWNFYGLDVINGLVRKPDSLFMEAKKQ